MADALRAKADILLFSELFLTGYFPEDLLLVPRFVEDAMDAAQALARGIERQPADLALLIPTVWREDATARFAHNAVLYAARGEIRATLFKRELPNDDVFYEQRYFQAQVRSRRRL